MSPVLVDPYRLGAAAVTGYAAAIAAAGTIVQRWKMDDVSGTTAVAAVGTNGTYAGSPTLGATGLVSDGGTAVTLDGNTQEMSVAVTTVSGTYKSILITFATTDTSQVVLFRDNNSAAGSGSFIQLGSGTAGPTTRTTGGGNRTSTYNSNLLRDGLKHQILITWDGVNAFLYIDGVQIDTWAVGAMNFVNSPLHFFRNGSSTGTANFYSGTLDDAVLFSNVVSGADAAAIWAAT